MSDKSSRNAIKVKIVELHPWLAAGGRTMGGLLVRDKKGCIWIAAAVFMHVFSTNTCMCIKYKEQVCSVVSRTGIGSFLLFCLHQDVDITGFVYLAGDGTWNMSREVQVLEHSARTEDTVKTPLLAHALYVLGNYL